MAEQRRGFVSRFLRSPTGLVGVVLLTLILTLGIFAGYIAPGPPFAFGFPTASPPSDAHLLGTDPSGRDMLFLITRGIRTTLTVVGIVMAVSLAIGTALGLVAGYAGGIVDSAITRVAEIIQAVPRFFLALVVIAIYGQGIDKIILLLSLTSWTFLARALRAETLSVKQRTFVDAARATGARGRSIVTRHILPHVMPRALVVVMLMGSRVILIEAGLAFLGLGDRSNPSLGVLASESQEYLRQAWWLSVFPGLGIAITVLGLNLLSDGLAKAIDIGSESGTPSRRRRP